MSNKYLPPVQHKFAVGTPVRDTYMRLDNKYRGMIGVVVELLPYTFIAPAYYVAFGNDIVVKSERSLEKIDSQSETV